MDMGAPAMPGTRRRTWRRVCLRLIALGTVCYLGVVLVLLALENALVYHPVRAEQDWDPPPNARVQDVELSSAGGTLVHAWWCPTEGWDSSRGAVLYCHGNAGNLSHWGATVALWQKELGEAVLIFDYPGYGRSGGKPSEAGCYAAAGTAYDWLTRKHIGPERILICGESLGSGVAVDLASRRSHRALVLISAFTSIPDVAQCIYPWLPARWLMRNRFNNLAKIGRCRAPLFMAHGTADMLVPFSQGRRLFEAASEPKHFFCMDGCDHDHRRDTELRRELRLFLAKTEGVQAGKDFPQLRLPCETPLTVALRPKGSRDP
jgi:hypothetical protein